MIKKDEISTPSSCLNKAADDEPVFVLRAKDPLAPTLVRRWAAVALAHGAHETQKIAEAHTLADQMEVWRDARY